jgi:hypothetical protein
MIKFRIICKQTKWLMGMGMASAAFCCPGHRLKLSTNVEKRSAKVEAEAEQNCAEIILFLTAWKCVKYWRFLSEKKEQNHDNWLVGKRAALAELGVIFGSRRAADAGVHLSSAVIMRLWEQNSGKSSQKRENKRSANLRLLRPPRNRTWCSRNIGGEGGEKEMMGEGRGQPQTKPIWHFSYDRAAADECFPFISPSKNGMNGEEEGGGGGGG